MSSRAPEYTAAIKSEPVMDLHPLQPAAPQVPHEKASGYPPSSCSGFDDGSIFDSNPDFASWASPTFTAIPEFSNAGQRCIFHWLPCRFQADHFDDWLEHIENHMTINPAGMGWGNKSTRIPNSWSCGFGCDFRIEENHDPKSIWVDKLRHVYQHILDGNPVERLKESPVWMEYYHQCLGIKKRAVPSKGRNIESEAISTISNERPILYSGRVPKAYRCRDYSGTDCVCVFQVRKALDSHMRDVHKMKAFACSASGCSYRAARYDNLQFHKRQHFGPTTNPHKSSALTGLIERKRPGHHIYTKPIPRFNDTETTHNQREITDLVVPALSEPISGSPLPADILYVLQSDEATKNEIPSARGEFELIDTQHTISRVDNTTDTTNLEREGKIQKDVWRSPQLEILGPSPLETSERPGETGANQKSSTIVSDHIRAASHREAKEMAVDTLGNQLLRETAARVRTYALQTVAELLRQQFAEYSLRFKNPNATTDTGESSSSGEFVSSTESGSRTSLPTAEPSQGRSICNKRKATSRQEGEGTDDDDEEPEDNRKKRPRMSKPSLCTPCVRRYACIYFANAMDSKDSQFLNVDLTRWQTECYRSGFETVARVKSHLYSHHQWGCKKCYRNFPTAEAHYDHSHGDCQESTETAPVFLSREQISRLKSKKPVPGVNTEEKKWRSVFRLVFPDQENIPSPYWEAVSLNCKKKHIDPSQLLSLLKRQFETAVLTKELLKPLDQALLGLKIVWGNVVDAIMENYPISENPNDIDMASWKTIFEDIVENTARGTIRNGDSDPTPSLVNSTHTASENSSEAAYESFQRTASPTIPESTILNPLSDSLFGFDKPQFNEPPTWTEPWKFNSFTGEPLGGNSAYLNETPVEWLGQDLSQFINGENLNTTEVE
ncbi:hypothetical protein TWF788_004037 [Orbilia oligospora]|uniref:C2H2-type domain-containing protein n=1 Tax=Orbilia oligospora TaxID=2813651 RepID=A0A7C8NVL8_ORBOL|nr:hypothetical protein TWF788_004037 [Orbilia oligospora]